MSEMSKEELLRVEAIGSEQGWAAPITQEDKEYFGRTAEQTGLTEIALPRNQRTAQKGRANL